MARQKTNNDGKIWLTTKSPQSPHTECVMGALYNAFGSSKGLNSYLTQILLAIEAGNALPAPPIAIRWETGESAPKARIMVNLTNRGKIAALYEQGVLRNTSVTTVVSLLEAASRAPRLLGVMSGACDTAEEPVQIAPTAPASTPLARLDNTIKTIEKTQAPVNEPTPEEPEDIYVEEPDDFEPEPEYYEEPTTQSTPLTQLDPEKQALLARLGIGV